jgi:hypothetical protein
VNRPLQLDTSSKYSKILELKKTLRTDLKNSFYIIEKQNKIIERYSDRYSQIKKTDLNKWKPGNFIILIIKKAYYYRVNMLENLISRLE